MQIKGVATMFDYLKAEIRKEINNFSVSDINDETAIKLRTIAKQAKKDRNFEKSIACQEMILDDVGIDNPRANGKTEWWNLGIFMINNPNNSESGTQLNGKNNTVDNSVLTNKSKTEVNADKIGNVLGGRSKIKIKKMEF